MEPGGGPEDQFTRNVQYVSRTPEPNHEFSSTSCRITNEENASGNNFHNNGSFVSKELSINNQDTNIIFNYSSVQLSDAMKRLLNRALNFAILPLKLDITEVLVDYNRFARVAIWQEYWHGREGEEVFVKPIFKKQKYNLPKKHSTPKGLKTFLESIKSEIMDHRNRNEVKCNLPNDEILALKELVRLQKDRIITLKACDKGAGIIILDFKAYMKACYDHLLSRQPNQQEGNETQHNMYYKKEYKFALERSKKHINTTLKEALNNNIISKEEYKAMDPEDKNPSKFYCIFKVHKAHEHKETPPPRPIVSGSGSITENISLYVEHHIKQIATQHVTYLQDTPHFLRIIEKLNKGSKLPKNAMIVTSDVIGAYQNIPHEDGSDCLAEALEDRAEKTIPSSFIVTLMNLVQKYNIFEFHDGMLWKQLIGVAMGIHPAPSYANIYLARRIDQKIIELGLKYGENNKSAFLLFKRFLDDLINIFKGTSKQLHKLFEEINNFHPTLKFTMCHTTPEEEAEEDRCDCEFTKSIPFLDTSLSIEDGKVEIDLYRKKTDRNQYLLPASCHPKSTSLSIPFSLSLRIVRICTNSTKRDLRLQELKIILLAREYPEDIVDAAINKARKIP